MQEGSSPSKDPGQIAFFVGNLCQEADLIYRFGYSLTLSEVGAERLLKETYRSLVGQLDRMLEYDSQEIRMDLMKSAWATFQSWKEKFESTDSLVLDFLQSLDSEVRGPLAVVDALGFTPEEAASIFELKEVEVRRYLSEGRKKLVGFEA